MAFPGYLLWDDCDAMLQNFAPTSLDIFSLYNPIFFILSFFWHYGLFFVKLLLCRYSSIRSTCLVLASHLPILIPRLGRLQGNTFSMHSAEDPVAVALFPLIFHIFLLVNDWYMLDFSIRCSSKPFFHTDKFRALYKKTYVSAILFVQRCTKQISRNIAFADTVSFWSMIFFFFINSHSTCHFSTNLLKLPRFLQQCLCREMEVVTPCNFSSESNNLCTADKICSN